MAFLLGDLESTNEIAPFFIIDFFNFLFPKKLLAFSVEEGVS